MSISPDGGARQHVPPSTVSPSDARYVLPLLSLVYVVSSTDRQILAILMEPIKRKLGVSTPRWAC